MSFFAEAQKDKGGDGKSVEGSKGTEHKFPLGNFPAYFTAIFHFVTAVLQLENFA